LLAVNNFINQEILCLFNAAQITCLCFVHSWHVQSVRKIKNDTPINHSCSVYFAFLSDNPEFTLSLSGNLSKC